MPTAEVNGAQLYYEVNGAGDPLVLVHGGFWDHQFWLAAAPLLADEFRVVTYDQRGHSRSRAVTADVSAQAWFDDLVGLIDALELAPAHVAGQSGGATIALNAALASPRSFRSLSLFEPGLFGLLNEPDTAPFYEQARAMSDPATKLLREGNFEGAAEHLINSIRGDDAAWASVPPPFQAMLTANMPIYTDLMDLSLPHWGIDLDAVRGIGVPVQLIAGTKSPPYFRPMLDKLGSALPDSTVETLAAGHGAPLETPAEYAAAVRNFIGRVSA